MSKLTKLLDYHCAGNSKRRSLMDSNSFINSFSQSEKQLLLSETDQTSLVYREVLGAILAGAETRQSARKALPVINTLSNICRVDHITAPSGQYAGFVAEGAVIPQDNITFSGSAINVKKAAVRAPITNELIEDCHYDIIELELRRAGALLENKLNQEVITKIVDGVSGPSDVDPNGSHIGTYDIGVAKGNVDSYGWMADTVILQPMAYGYLLDETNIGDITDGKHKLIGLNTYILDAVVDGTGTNKWTNYDAATNYGAAVFDSYNFAAIAMREDINIGKFNDPIHDLLNLTVKMRFGVKVLNADAGCLILAK